MTAPVATGDAATSTVRVGVCIPSSRREALLERCLLSVQAAAGGDADVVYAICTDGEAEADARLRKIAPDALIVAAPGRTAAAKRNMLLDLLDCDAVVFLDDDVVVPADFFRSLVTLLAAHPTTAVFGGPNLTDLATASRSQRVVGALLAATTVVGTAARRHRVGSDGHAGPDRFVLCNLVARTAELGRFDDEFATAEETRLLAEMDQRGGTMWFDRALAVSHERRTSIAASMLQIHGWGVGRGMHVRRGGGWGPAASAVKAALAVAAAVAVLSLQAGAAVAVLTVGGAWLAAVFVEVGVRFRHLRTALAAAVVAPAVPVVYLSGVVRGALRRPGPRRALVGLRRSAAVVLAGNVASAVATIPFGVMVARHFGASGRGIVETGAALAVIAARVAGCGLGPGLLFDNRRRAAPARAGLSAVAVAAALSGVVPLAGVVALRWALVSPTVAVLLSSVPAMVLCLEAGSVLRAEGRTVTAAWLVVARSGLLAAASAALWWAAQPLLVAAAAWSAAWWSGAALTILALRHGWTGPSPGWRNALRYGLLYQVPSVVAAAGRRADIVVVLAIAGSAQAGRYAAASGLALLVTHLPIAGQQALFPWMVNRDADDDLAEVVRFHRMLVAATASTALAIAAAGGSICTLVLGPSFSGLSTQIALCAAASTAAAAASLSTTLLHALGDVSVPALVSAGWTATQLAVAAALTIRFGGTGAAIGSLVAALCAASLLTTRAARAAHASTGAMVFVRRADLSRLVPLFASRRRRGQR